MPGSAEIQLLGSFRLTLDGASVRIAAPMHRAIIARLALAAGETVSTDQLIADLWEAPPTSAAGSLRVHLSRLRASPVGPFLHGGRGGYRLEDVTVDAVAFRRLLGPERSGVKVLAEAAALWVGPPLDGLPLVPFVRRVREELETERARLLHRLGKGHLEGGDLAGAIDVLGELLLSHPEDEEAVELLATAQSRAGRTAAALASIDAFEARMRSEAGLDASPRLRSLRQAVLRHESSVAPPPPPSSVTRYRMPLPLTPFIGRARQLARLEEALTRARLTTVVGPGGVGKTRLAVEVARRSTRLPDEEQWMLDLQAVRNRAGLLAAAASVFGSAEPSLESIATRLDGRNALVLIDNAEHLLSEVGELCSSLLQSSRGIVLLVTSREPLGVPGERLLSLEPMLGEDLADAVDLFSARAADALLGFEAEGAAIGTIERLATSLDGLPLGLELAAAQLRTMSLEELEASVRSGEPVGRRSDGSARHASTADAVRWSVQLLTPDQRAMLTQLAAFEGGFARDAVEGICQAGERPPGFLLDELAQKSLVAVARSEEGRVSFRILESVKHFARSLGGVPDGWRERHRAWFVGFARQAGSKLRTSEESAAAAEITLYRADLIAALEDAIRSAGRSAALGIVGGMHWYWFRRSALVEAMSWIDAALAVQDGPGSAGGPDEHADAELESEVWIARGLTLYQLADLPEAERSMQEAIRHAAVARRPDLESTALSALGYLATLRGAEPEVIEQRLVAATAAAARASGAASDFVALTEAQMLRSLGRYPEAQEAVRTGGRRARAAGNAWAVIMADTLAAKLLLDLRRGADALAILLPALRRSRADTDPVTTLIGLYLAAAAAATLDRNEAGAQLIGAVEALGRRYSFDPVANEPADFELYRRRVREGLTSAEWERMRAAGTSLSFDDAVRLVEELAAKLSSTRRVRHHDSIPR